MCQGIQKNNKLVTIKLIFFKKNSQASASSHFYHLITVQLLHHISYHIHHSTHRLRLSHQFVGKDIHKFADGWQTNTLHPYRTIFTQTLETIVQNLLVWWKRIVGTYQVFQSLQQSGLAFSYVDTVQLFWKVGKKAKGLSFVWEEIVVVDLNQFQQDFARLSLKLVIEFAIVENSFNPSGDFLNDSVSNIFGGRLDPLQTHLFNLNLISSKCSIHRYQLNYLIESSKSHFTNHSMLFNQFRTNVLNEFSFLQRLQESFVVLCQKWYIVESCSPHLPTLLVSFRLLVVSIIVIVPLLNHLLTSVTHHSFHIELQQLFKKRGIGTLLGHHFLPNFSTECSHHKR